MVGVFPPAVGKIDSNGMGVFLQEPWGLEDVCSGKSLFAGGSGGLKSG
jgi:hypothetical protein